MYDKLTQKMSDRDVNVYWKLFTKMLFLFFTKQAKNFQKSDWAGMVTGMVANDKFIQNLTRCVYENANILVQHAFMSYPDDTKEAVMMGAMSKDDKIIHMETGATPLN